jgi:hypothetical protein
MGYQLITKLAQEHSVSSFLSHVTSHYTSGPSHQI